MKKRISSGVVAAVLDGMAMGLSVSKILEFTGASTTIFYKVVADYPLWSHQYQKEDDNA